MLKVAYLNDVLNHKISCKDEPWLYFGDIYDIDNVLHGTLLPNRRLWIGKQINELADELRGNFVNYIGVLSTEQENLVLWYSSRVASKSVQTSFFFHYIYIKFLQRVAENKIQCLFITERCDLIKNLSILKIPGIEIVSELRNYVSHPYQNKRNCSDYLNFKDIIGEPDLDYDILLWSWLIKDIYSTLPKYNDIYFGNLPTILTQAGYRVGRLAPVTGISIQDAVEAKKYFPNIIFPLSFLNQNDVKKVLETKFQVNLPQKVSGIKDLDILNCLMLAEIKKENDSGIFADNLISYKALSTISKELNKNTKILYPFENQPWEKMLHFACHDNYRIGFQHTPIPVNWLDYYISKHELNCPVPSVIVTTGGKYQDFFKSMYRTTPVENMGSLRYNHITSRPKIIKKAQEKIVLIALPILVKHANDLLRKIIIAYEAGILKGVVVVIRPHPAAMPDSRLISDLCNRANIRLDNLNVADSINNSYIVITTGTAIALESVALGKKTIYYVPEDISLGYEHELLKWLYIIYSHNFNEELRNVMQMDRDVSKEVPFDVENFLVKFNEEKILNLLREPL